MNKDYEEGLNEAWEIARKIVLHNYNEAYSADEVLDIWGDTSYFVILKEYTGKEALERLREYEKKKKEKIHVGDEIIHKNTNEVMVVVYSGNELIETVDSKGVCYSYDIEDKIELSKTGRNFPQIEEVLKEMRNNKNENDN